MFMNYDPGRDLKLTWNGLVSAKPAKVPTDKTPAGRSPRNAALHRGQCKSLVSIARPHPLLILPSMVVYFSH
jgi:hypothetical protein